MPANAYPVPILRKRYAISDHPDEKLDDAHFQEYASFIDHLDEKGFIMAQVLDKIGVLTHGENAKQSELNLTYLVGTIAGIIVVAQSLSSGTIESLVQIVVLFLVAMDVVSGVIANSTRSTNTWYHQRAFHWQFLFLVVHIVHPLLAVLVLDPGNWLYLGGVYLYMLIAGSIVLRLASGDWQRPVAVALFVLGVIISVYWLNPAPAMAWFAPLYFAKLIICFSVDYYGVRHA